MAHRYVHGGGGNAVKTLIVGERMVPKKCANPNIPDDFEQYCPNVTSLNICEYKGLWTERFGDKTDALKIVRSRDGVRAVAKHCTRLRELCSY